MLSPEKALAKELRYKGWYVCWEVSLYGSRADVLAVHPHKKMVLEYEFKRSSHDLRNVERKKEKYKLEKVRRYPTDKQQELLKTDKYCFEAKKEPLHPHRFYFVMPEELWEKEKEYLNTLKFEGVIVWYYKDAKPSLGLPDTKKIKFRSVKNVVTRKKNLQKYEVAKEELLSRLSALLMIDLNKGEKHEDEQKTN